MLVQINFDLEQFECGVILCDEEMVEWVHTALLMKQQDSSSFHLNISRVHADWRVTFSTQFHQNGFIKQ